MGHVISLLLIQDFIIIYRNINIWSPIHYQHFIQVLSYSFVLKGIISKDKMIVYLLPIHALLRVGQWATKSLLVTAVTPGLCGQGAHFTLNRVELTQSSHRNDVRAQQIWVAHLVFDLHQLGADVIDQCIQILAEFADVFIFLGLTHKDGILQNFFFQHNYISKGQTEFKCIFCLFSGNILIKWSKYWHQISKKLTFKQRFFYVLYWIYEWCLTILYL